MGAGSVAAAFGPGNAVIGAIHGGFVFFFGHPRDAIISCQCADPYELVDPGRSQ